MVRKRNWVTPSTLRANLVRRETTHRRARSGRSCVQQQRCGRCRGARRKRALPVRWNGYLSLAAVLGMAVPSQFHLEVDRARRARLRLAPHDGRHVASGREAV